MPRDERSIAVIGYRMESSPTHRVVKTRKEWKKKENEEKKDEIP